MKIKVPSQLIILGCKTTIIYQKTLFDEDNESLLGSCCSDSNTIAISLDHHSLESLLETLYHEVVHMVLKKSGLDNMLEGNLEETLVRCIENNIFPFFKINKRRWKKIIEVKLN